MGVHHRAGGGPQQTSLGKSISISNSRLQILNARPKLKKIAVVLLRCDFLFCSDVAHGGFFPESTTRNPAFVHISQPPNKTIPLLRISASGPLGPPLVPADDPPQANVGPHVCSPPPPWEALWPAARGSPTSEAKPLPTSTPQQAKADQGTKLGDFESAGTPFLALRTPQNL